MPGFRFVKLDIADREVTAAFFVAEPLGRVLHLAVQAGFRYSLLSLHAYLDSNPVVFLNVLKGCRHNPL